MDHHLHTSSSSFTNTTTVSLTLLLLHLLFSSINGAHLQTYIVSVRPPPIFPTSDTGKSLKNYYKSFLPRPILPVKLNDDEPRLIHSYVEAFSGFAARLTKEELKEVEKKKGFLRAYPDHVIPLHTTRTPSFLGLRHGVGLWNRSTNLGEGVVVAILDTGITPTHLSFDDTYMPPPPPSWKGRCKPTRFCNNKIIAARSFVSFSSPLDDDGHGTHTAGTAVGGFVPDANLLGSAPGTAAGIAPRAHLAVYKVCTGSGCIASDVLAGLDAAIDDGVDVISLSLGGPAIRLDRDPIAIGTLAAARRGIFTSCSAGNGGPRASTLSNSSPWMLTVAATTLDRELRSTVRLGDSREFHGQAIRQVGNGKPSRGQLPIVKVGACEGSPGVDVVGKLIWCYLVGEDLGFLEGAAGIIRVNTVTYGDTVALTLLPLPSSHVGNVDGRAISEYVLWSKGNATASIFLNGTAIGTTVAPSVAAFSSRGPSLVNPHVVKPDISAPGVNILAAWNSDPTGSNAVGRHHFNVMSGTSMATPHASGVAALLKKAHPDWSPAAIKSAMITTADVVGTDGKPIKNEKLDAAGLYEMGSGNINPERAADPGLVYDVDSDDYLRFLCGLKLMDYQVSVMSEGAVSCEELGKIEQWDLNYPTISVSLPAAGRTVVVKRTVMNVGPARATYRVEVDKVEGLEVKVTPARLVFKEVKEKKRFSVEFKRRGTIGVAEGSLRWVSRRHVVRSAFHVQVGRSRN